MMRSFMERHIRAFLGDESGATAIEYGMILVMITVAIVLAVGELGVSVTGIFSGINTQIAP